MQQEIDIMGKLIKLIQARSEELKRLYKPLRLFSLLSVEVNVIVMIFTLFENRYISDAEMLHYLLRLTALILTTLWIVFLKNYYDTYKSGHDVWKIVANELEWGKSRKSFVHKQKDEKIQILTDFHECSKYRFAPFYRGRIRQMILMCMNLSLLVIIFSFDLLREKLLFFSVW